MQLRHTYIITTCTFKFTSTINIMNSVIEEKNLSTFEEITRLQKKTNSQSGGHY